MKTYKKLIKTKKPLITLAIIIVCSILAFIILEITNITHIINQKNTETTNTTSTEPSAQNNFNNGADRNVIQLNKNEGTVTDTNGDITIIPPENEWSSSIDGIVLVYSPAKNSSISNGQIISGESTNGDVSFRLIDNVSGMIAQGKIIAVNNKFSGVFNFNTTASEGRLDIFITSADGIESSVVEIPVSFNQ